MEKETLQEMESKLAKQFLNREDTRLRAYICSPLSADTDEGVLNNMYQARQYMFYASENLDMAARAPHAYLPMLLCDRIPVERAMALRFDMELLEESDIVLVCGEKISGGMKEEIIHAVHIKARIMTFSHTMYMKVLGIVRSEHGDSSLLECCMSHEFMTGKTKFPEKPVKEITMNEYSDFMDAKDRMCRLCQNMDCLQCPVTWLAEEAERRAEKSGILKDS